MGINFGALAGGLAQGIERGQALHLRAEEEKRRQEEQAEKRAERARQQGEREAVAQGLNSIGKDSYADSFQQLTGMSPQQVAAIEMAAQQSGDPAKFMAERLAGSAAGDTASVIKPQTVTKGMAMRNIARNLAPHNAERALQYEERADAQLTKEKVNQINQLFNQLESGQIDAATFGQQAASLYNTGVNDGNYAGVSGDQMMVVDPRTGRGMLLDLKNAEHRLLMRQRALMAVDPSYMEAYGKTLQGAIGNEQAERGLNLKKTAIDNDFTLGSERNRLFGRQIDQDQYQFGLKLSQADRHHRETLSAKGEPRAHVLPEGSALVQGDYVTQYNPKLGRHERMPINGGNDAAVVQGFVNKYAPQGQGKPAAQDAATPRLPAFGGREVAAGTPEGELFSSARFSLRDIVGRRQAETEAGWLTRQLRSGRVDPELAERAKRTYQHFPDAFPQDVADWLNNAN